MHPCRCLCLYSRTFFKNSVHDVCVRRKKYAYWTCTDSVYWWQKYLWTTNLNVLIQYSNIAVEKCTVEFWLGENIPADAESIFSIRHTEDGHRWMMGNLERKERWVCVGTSNTVACWTCTIVQKTQFCCPHNLPGITLESVLWCALTIIISIII